MAINTFYKLFKKECWNRCIFAFNFLPPRHSFVPIVRHVRNDKTTTSGRREGCLSYVDRRQNWHIRRVRNGSGVWDVLEGFEGARQINIWGICCRMKTAWETHRLFGGSVKGISNDFYSSAYRKCREPLKIYIDI